MADPEAFALDPRLDADTVPVGDLFLSRVLLMNDARFPWLVLVPRRPGLVEIADLDPRGQAMLQREVEAAADAMRHLHAPDKLNIAAIGNVVAQLHVHVVGRRRDDEAWPRPVWGSGPARPYAPEQCETILRAFSAALGRLSSKDAR
jgi:diadenosine tetraphosphate (Ap4A) HIT family hydrolase